MRKSFYEGKKVLLTGGASFIGSHLLDKLIALGAETTVISSKDSPHLANVFSVWMKHGIHHRDTSYGFSAGRHACRFVSLEDYPALLKAVKGTEIVFHLAAVHGGRGFINTHPADCCGSFTLNQNMIKAAYEGGADRLFFSSSACVYPVKMQQDYHTDYLLKEEDAFKDSWGNADQEYGWAKLMGEMTLKAFHKQYGFKSSAARYISVYGPGAKESHAIIALILRALRKEDPYLIWGNGEQRRDFTYVDDVVEGSLAACEHITDATAINLGTGERFSINEVANMIFDIIGWKPSNIRYDKSKPEGSKSRALDYSLAKKLLKWHPRTNLKTGLERTIESFRSAI